MPGQVPKTQELGRFAASFRRLRFEKPSASGGFAPLSPHQGLCPWTPLGALPPDSRYRLMLRPRHGLAPSNENFCLRPWLTEVLWWKDKFALCLAPWWVASNICLWLSKIMLSGHKLEIYGMSRFHRLFQKYAYAIRKYFSNGLMTLSH